MRVENQDVRIAKTGVDAAHPFKFKIPIKPVNFKSILMAQSLMPSCTLSLVGTRFYSVIASANSGCVEAVDTATISLFVLLMPEDTLLKKINWINLTLNATKNSHHMSLALRDIFVDRT